MRGHGARLLEAINARLRRLDHRLHIDHSRGEWPWAMPVLAFAVTVTVFVVAGVTNGVWAAEYIPTGCIVALVISGLIVASMTPDDLPPEDWGGGGDDTSPPPLPRVDPSIWLRLLADADLPQLSDPAEPRGERHAEPSVSGR